MITKLVGSICWLGTIILLFQQSIYGIESNLQINGIPIRTIAWHPDDEILAVSGTNEEVWLYTSSLQPIIQIPINNQRIGELEWSLNGEKLAISTYAGEGDARVYIWNNQNATIQTIIQQEDNASPDVTWYIDNIQLATNRFQDVHIWNADTGVLLDTITPTSYPDTVGLVAWSHDGSKLMTTGGSVQIWNTSNFVNPETLTLNDIRGNIIWSPDDNFLALGSIDRVYIWNITNRNLETSLTGYTDSIVEIDWKGNRLVTWSWNDQIHIWDTETWTLIEIINGSNARGTNGALALRPDGTKLAYASANGELTVIPTPGSSTCNTTQTISAGDVAGLISAINTANANPDADVIGLAAGTYTFTAVNNNRNALPRITTDITICSTDGATLTRSSSAPQFRLFEVRSTGKLTLENLTLTNGSLGVDDDGGAIFNLGTLTVNTVTFSNNQAGVGGAIASEGGQITVTDSTFTNNASTGDGGAIHSEADLLIESSTFTGNSADDAGAVNNDGGTLTVTDSTFSDNSADDGGAIYNDAGTLTLSGSTFTDNTGDAGGALDNLDGQAQIDSSTFTGNSASDGGAMRNYGGTITLTTSRFTGNMATDDGGALNNSGGTLTITDTRLENNTATTRGGAIYSNSSGTMSAHNSCISGNSVTAVYAASTGLQDFTGNWWGSATGPGGAGPGSGDTINSKINHANFLTAGCPLP